ncbi:GIY-YIG nuclease family protein [Paracraurococcus lichenis]|uniref:GIY-YIG nuclease family protein n=1 Tax=Paracraurococcus lichenis TaxID=3064888 RepID=A0ABT9EAH6_9PROT|nr:GIY-YIG nuclease family protein [Paracraurococcus sp. LOR1-02]MDO9713201.1 GIY-YIG nuclease family protein [Paracraurococcus sp. LOR1-02]
MTRTGYVYVLTNPAMPGMVKVGMTERHPYARAKELSAHTGVPSPFQVAWFAEVEVCAAVEAAVKVAMDRYRVNGRREFFSVTVPEAREAIERAAAGRLGRRVVPRPAGRLRRRGHARWGMGVVAARAALLLVLALVALRWL